MKLNRTIFISLLLFLGFTACSDGDGLVDLTNRKFVRINQESITVAVGEEYKITASFDSEQTASKKFTWSILDTSIATVVTNEDNSGTITGVSRGTTVIQVESEDKKLKYFSTLNIRDYPVYIDFGPVISGAPFNNYAFPGDEKLTGLLDEKGNNTGFAIEVVSEFGWLDRDIHNTLGFPREVSNDMFFNDGIHVASGTLIVSNLNTGQKYTFAFYGSINDSNTENEYRVAGKNEGVVYQSSGFNEADLAVVENIIPNDDGTVTITIQAGPDNTHWAKFYGINAMIITPEDYVD